MSDLIKSDLEKLPILCDSARSRLDTICDAIDKTLDVISHTNRRVLRCSDGKVYWDITWNPDTQNVHQARRIAQYINRIRHASLPQGNPWRLYRGPQVTVKLEGETLEWIRHDFGRIPFDCMYSSLYNHPIYICQVMTCNFCNKEQRVYRQEYSPTNRWCCYYCDDIHVRYMRINPSKVKRNPPTIVDDNGDQWNLAEPEELDVGREVLFMKSPTDEKTLAIIEKVNKKSVRVKATMKRGKYPIDRMYTVTFPCVYVWDDDNDDEPTYIKGEVN